jgi:hypothetical protein
MPAVPPCPVPAVPPAIAVPAEPPLATPPVPAPVEVPLDPPEEAGWYGASLSVHEMRRERRQTDERWSSGRRTRSSMMIPMSGAG